MVTLHKRLAALEQRLEASQPSPFERPPATAALVRQLRGGDGEPRRASTDAEREQARAAAVALGLGRFVGKRERSG